MTVQKLKNGKFQARFQFDRRRYKKAFNTSREARAWEADTLRQLAAGDVPVISKDRRQLSELVDLWFQLHGRTLKDGEGRVGRLRHIVSMMGDPLARSLNANYYSRFRTMRLEGGASENTCNHDLAYIKALFNELIRHDEWKHENPVAKVRKLKFDEKEMRYLTKEEIDILLAACEQSRVDALVTVVKICLRTGARWSEAKGLTSHDIKIDGNRAWIVYEGTKSGRVRRVPVDVKFARYVRGDHIGNAPLFDRCISAFRHALRRSEIQLPAGQASHVLRHTFASHYMMRGGDVLKLQKLLGHSTILMTMRYAHLAPDALDDVLDKHALN